LVPLGVKSVLVQPGKEPGPSSQMPVVVPSSSHLITNMSLPQVTFIAMKERPDSAGLGLAARALLIPTVFTTGVVQARAAPPSTAPPRRSASRRLIPGCSAWVSTIDSCLCPDHGHGDELAIVASSHDKIRGADRMSIRPKAYSSYTRSGMGSDLVGPPVDGIIETEIDGDIALYDPAREVVAVLNGTASDIWRLADGTETVNEIGETLAKAYRVDPSVVAADIERTIRTLRSDGFLASE
jgi:hypothetical protein